MTASEVAFEQTDDESAPSSGRTLILRNSARLFRNKGYAATSLRQIAAECNMKAGSIYYHFESKDAIIMEVLRIGVAQVFDEVRRVTTELGDNADPHDLIHVAILAHLRALHETIDYSSANIRIFGQVPEHVKQAHMPLRKEYEAYWQELFRRCQEAGAFAPDKDVKIALFLLIGMINSTLEWYHQDRLSIEKLAAIVTELFMKGMS